MFDEEGERARLERAATCRFAMSSTELDLVCHRVAIEDPPLAHPRLPLLQHSADGPSFPFDAVGRLVAAARAARRRSA